MTLLNYFAAALTMPYGRFREAAEDLAYDIETLGARFEASFEQVCHRLTTLQRPRARGVAFFMLRMDAAGNVSKRLSAAEFPFSRFGGACPLWNVHAAFAAPGRILTQTIEMPDGKRFFSVARTVERAGGPHDRPNPPSAVALVCHAGDAPRLIHARGGDPRAAEATPVGVNCRLCPRADCAQRGAPAAGIELREGVFEKRASPFGAALGDGRGA